MTIKRVAKNSRPENNLLAALPSKEYQRLKPGLKPFEFKFGEIICKTHDEISDVYFVNSGIVSLVSGVGTGTTLELGIVGNEGMVGLPVFLGNSRSANQAVVQGEGHGLSLKSSALTEECRMNGALPGLLLYYTSDFLGQISQSAICNQYHRITSRLARWLLMMKDKMRKNELQLTQEFLSNMLGVRREAVSKAANKLQEKNLIEYSRGTIRILDLAGLNAAACTCFSLLKQAEANRGY